MEPIRNERMEIVGYREEVAGGRVNIRNKHRELIGWTQSGQTRKKDGTLVLALRELESAVWWEEDEQWQLPDVRESIVGIGSGQVNA